MAKRPYSRIPPMKQVAFIAALLSPAARPEGPTLLPERRECQWRTAAVAFHDVRLAGSGADLLRAADKLIRCPIPAGARSRMVARLRQKRQAMRECGHRAEEHDWAEIIAAETAALLPVLERNGGR